MNEGFQVGLMIILLAICLLSEALTQLRSVLGKVMSEGVQVAFSEYVFLTFSMLLKTATQLRRVTENILSSVSKTRTDILMIKVLLPQPFRLRGNFHFI